MPEQIIAAMDRNTKALSDLGEEWSHARRTGSILKWLGVVILLVAIGVGVALWFLVSGQNDTHVILSRQSGQTAQLKTQIANQQEELSQLQQENQELQSLLDTIQRGSTANSNIISQFEASLNAICRRTGCRTFITQPAQTSPPTTTSSPSNGGSRSPPTTTTTTTTLFRVPPTTRPPSTTTTTQPCIVKLKNGKCFL